MNKIYERVKRIVAEQLGVDEDKITYEAFLVDDLGADLLDTVAIVMAFEEEFACEISDQEVEKIAKVKDAISLIERKIIMRQKTFSNKPQGRPSEHSFFSYKLPRNKRSLLSKVGTSGSRIMPAATPKQPQYEMCRKCNGKGWIFNPSLHQLAPYVGSPGRVTCPFCKGLGKHTKFSD